MIEMVRPESSTGSRAPSVGNGQPRRPVPQTAAHVVRRSGRSSREMSERGRRIERAVDLDTRVGTDDRRASRAFGEERAGQDACAPPAYPNSTTLAVNTGESRSRGHDPVRFTQNHRSERDRINAEVQAPPPAPGRKVETGVIRNHCPWSADRDDVAESPRQGSPRSSRYVEAASTSPPSEQACARRTPARLGGIHRECREHRLAGTQREECIGMVHRAESRRTRHRRRDRPPVRSSRAGWECRTLGESIRRIDVARPDSHGPAGVVEAGRQRSCGRFRPFPNPQPSGSLRVSEDNRANGFAKGGLVVRPADSQARSVRPSITVSKRSDSDCLRPRLRGTSCPAQRAAARSRTRRVLPQR